MTTSRGLFRTSSPVHAATNYCVATAKWGLRKIYGRILYTPRNYTKAMVVAAPVQPCSWFCVTNGNRGWIIWSVIKVSAVSRLRERELDLAEQVRIFPAERTGCAQGEKLSGSFSLFVENPIETVVRKANYLCLSLHFLTLIFSQQLWFFRTRLTISEKSRSRRNLQRYTL